MTDDTGRQFSAQIVASQPVVEGFADYELEVPADVDMESLRFTDTEDVEDTDDLCPATRFVGTQVRRCILHRGHPGPHQFQL
jgi:hypothetical protein